MTIQKHPALIVRQLSPYNGGPALSHLINNFITPNELFFVRNHGAVPVVDPADYRLEVRGTVKQPLNLSLAEIKTGFPTRSVTATLQCAGNRRTELSAFELIPHELGWGAEAISTANWRGVPLAAVLQAAGVAGDGHVAFLGLDETERKGQRIHYGGSIPLAKALRDEVLLAFEMNGAPLPPTHGFPVRVIVPGYIGARSIKWLQRLTVQAAPSDNYFQATAYRLFAAHERADTVNVEAGLMLGECSVNAVICEPDSNQPLRAGAQWIRGYAFAGGGRPIARVDISADGGSSWRAAELPIPESGWAWQLWQIKMNFECGPCQLVARAIDSAANGMPEEVRSIWNFKGYMNNAWHRVNISVE